MPRNRLPRVMKCCSPTGRRNHGRPFEETSGYVRPEWVNKWPNSMTYIYDDDDDSVVEDMGNLGDPWLYSVPPVTQ